jgi:hypothetical protein
MSVSKSTDTNGTSFELYWQDGMLHEPFEESPFVPVTERGYENESEFLSHCDKTTNKQCSRIALNSMKVPPGFEKDIAGQDTLASLARIKVVVKYHFNICTM